MSKKRTPSAVASLSLVNSWKLTLAGGAGGRRGAGASCGTASARVFCVGDVEAATGALPHAQKNSGRNSKPRIAAGQGTRSPVQLPSPCPFLVAGGADAPFAAARELAPARLLIYTRSLMILRNSVASSLGPRRVREGSCSRT